MDNCVFCNGTINKQIVFSTYHFIVIITNKPIVPDHYLIIPKRHVRDWAYFNIQEWLEFPLVVKWVRERVGEIFCFLNAPDGQSVHHYHLHCLKNPFKPHGAESALRKAIPVAESLVELGAYSLPETHLKE